MSETVAAVVVTYNRARLLLECLDGLLRQSRPIDKIVLVDNASSDDTVKELGSHGYLSHPKIDYHRLPTNSGGAGGFHTGMKLAFEAGYDWLWIMDDDAEPHPDALEKMLPSMRQSGVAGVANLTVGFDGEAQIEHRGWLRLRSTQWRAHYAIEGKSLPERLEITFASFVGIAVPRSAVEQIGLPRAELFIKGDDLEYCVRLAALGPIILVAGSKIIHKEGQNASFRSIRRFGMESMRIPLDRLWLTYFPLRNLIWIRRHHCGSGLAARFAVRAFLRIVLGVLVFDDNHRWVRLKFYWNALTDAWRGTFDNEKPRRLTGVLPAIAKR